MNGLLASYPGHGYGEPGGDPWAAAHDPVHDPVHDGVFAPGDWCGESLAHGVGFTYAGPPLSPPVTMPGDGRAEGGFVPAQRAPVTQSAPRMAGPADPPASRHRKRSRPPATGWSDRISSTFGVLTAVTVTAVCVLGWALSYHPLRELALSRVPRGLSQLWPVVLYGPWLAGCLSVLRAALHGRPPLHSWVVVVVFSALATGLCVADAARTVPAVIVAGLPPVTAVVSLQQLVRQLTAARSARQQLGRPATHRAPR
ncbi:DUF2637 domain-containing protein [Kitasatospora sp. MBT63]|uniref:DUF2637 domain-containing protein n=1 Tax=Kitasatospora sp. MBT63 TaxID=1444768 RepID=UPI0011EA66FC|nr:DUF2637 domain-containing protein [Kitasatospora sp. MBT63]